MKKTTRDSKLQLGIARKTLRILTHRQLGSAWGGKGAGHQARALNVTLDVTLQVTLQVTLAE